MLPTIRGMRAGRDAKQVLWANTLAAMKHKYGAENLNALSRDAKIGPGSASRIKQQKTAIGLDVVQKVAASFELEAWQLLMPDLDPTNPPVFALSDEQKRFHDKMKRAYQELTKGDK